MAGLHRPLFITGMMGSGKSTVGHMLARALDVEFVDLDQRIERIFGQPVAEMFAASEAHFRERETLALRSLIAEPGFAARGVVVATGGGTPIDPTNRDAMLGCGTIVFLEVPIPVLAARLDAGAARTTRPLLTGQGGGTGVAPTGLVGRLSELYARRAEAYLDRCMRVDGTEAPAVVVQRLLAALDGGEQSGETEPGTQAV